jgi:hypothetical protein
MPKIYRMETEIIIAQIPRLVNDQDRTIETQTQIMYTNHFCHTRS